MDDIKQVTTAWEDYQNGIAYQQDIGLPKRVKECVDFFEGRQWAPTTKRTKALPRPVVNIVKMIVRAKKSAMNNTPVRVVFEADSKEQDTDAFTRFADYIFKEMRIAEIDSQAILDAAIKGCYIYHFYWDKDARGRKANTDGAVRCDLLDPRNVFFANPAQCDEQKQKWIIIATREEVESVKARADKGVDKDMICADERDYDVETETDKEQDGTEMCTVLTRYFRKDGEVYCEKSTRRVVVNKAFRVAPDYEAAAKELGYETDDGEREDAANTDSPDKYNSGANKGYRATLYPVVVGQYEKRERCIYGMSEVEGLIPNQKCINLQMALEILATQTTAWPKWIAKPDALKGQDITNEPGQLLIDHSKTGNGLRQEAGAHIGGQPAALIDSILSYTRTVSGSTEVMTGEAVGANMSGAAIAQLQAQAQQPIEELRDGFWRVKEKQGKVLEQFFRLFYADAAVPYTFTEYNPETHKEEGLQAQFNASEYASVEFTVVAKATTGTRSSTAGDITFLDNLLKANAITIEQYADAYPEDALSDKEKYKRLLQANKESENAQLKAALEQSQQQLQEMVQWCEDYKKAVASVQSVRKENESLQKDLSILAGLVQQYEQRFGNMLDIAKTAASDAQLFAGEIARAEGLMGQQYGQPVNNDEDIE